MDRTPSTDDLRPVVLATELQQLRLLLVDDSVEVRELLATLLGRRPDLQVVAEAGNGEQAIELAAALQPDMIILDVTMPLLDGISALPRLTLAAPHARIVMFSALPADQNRSAALAAGAAAYVEKSVPPSRLVDELLAGAKLLDVAVRGLTEHVGTTLEADPRQAALARRFATDALEAWDHAEIADILSLLLTELVTNAIVHAHAAPTVSVRLLPDRVHVEVSDTAADLSAVQPKPLTSDQGSGRGLAMIDLVAMHWGIAPLPGGKVVWFDIARS